jgi:hypothetical protein
MSAWLERLDAILGHYPHLVAALEAVSTFAAVVISLSLAFAAHRANKTRFKAWVDIQAIHHSSIDTENRPTYITARITNMGVMPLRVPFAFFNWQLPILRHALWTVNLMDAYSMVQLLVPQQTYPVEIQPRASKVFFVSDVITFRDESIFEDVIRRYGVIGRRLFPFIKVTIYTDDGTRRRAKIGHSARREINRQATQ